MRLCVLTAYNSLRSMDDYSLILSSNKWTWFSEGWLQCYSHLMDQLSSWPYSHVACRWLADVHVYDITYCQ